MVRMLAVVLGVLMLASCESQPRAGVKQYDVVVRVPEESARLYVVPDKDWLNRDRDEALLRSQDFLRKYRVMGTGMERKVTRPGFQHIAIVEHEGRWGRSNAFNPFSTRSVTVSYE